MTWPVFRTIACTNPIVSSRTAGLNHRRIGPMILEVRLEESASVDPQKMKIIQSAGGSQ